MVSLSVDGLVSGLDTTSLISQLVQAEAAPQTALKTRLTTTQDMATAYRSVNTKMAAVRTAAEALTGAGLAAARTATSSSPDVTASAGTAAVDGTGISFTVTSLASAHTVTSKLTWTSATDPVRTPVSPGADPGWPLTVLDEDGTAVGTIPLGDGATLRDAAAAINASSYGLKATVVQAGPKEFRLQVTSTQTGADARFTLRGTTEAGATAGSAFTAHPVAADAQLKFPNGFTATSSTNTFPNLISGVTVTVSKADPQATTTVRVGADAEGVATKVQALVDAANAALIEIAARTASGTTAKKGVLSGDPTLSSLAGQVLDLFSRAVGDNGSPVKLGIQLNREGRVQFDRTKFAAAYAADPQLVQDMVTGTPATTDANGDEVPAVAGVAARLVDLAKRATDGTTGTLTVLAKGRDALADDIEERIEDWDLRLATRRATLTAQFTAMETALGSLKQQSSWLSGQLASLS